MNYVRSREIGEKETKIQRGKEAKKNLQ